MYLPALSSTWTEKSRVTAGDNSIPRFTRTCELRSMVVECFQHTFFNLSSSLPSKSHFSPRVIVRTSESLEAGRANDDSLSKAGNLNLLSERIYHAHMDTASGTYLERRRCSLSVWYSNDTFIRHKKCSGFWRLRGKRRTLRFDSVM